MKVRNDTRNSYREHLSALCGKGRIAIMKKINNYILIFALSLATNLMAQDSLVLPKFSDIKEIKLHTGEIITA
jgi:hypothetical protein